MVLDYCTTRDCNTIAPIAGIYFIALNIFLEYKINSTLQYIKLYYSIVLDKKRIKNHLKILYKNIH